MSISSLQKNIEISICIITYNRPHFLEKCLAGILVCLKNLPSLSYEIVVSDDSVQHSAYHLVNQLDNARWVQGPSLGVASNRNNVSKAAAGKWIIFVDDDELPDPNWLNFLCSSIAADIWDVIEGSVLPISYPDNIFWYAPVIKSGGNFCTANLAIRRSFLFSLGGFNEKFNISHEDVELGQRIRNSGARTLFLKEAVVFHPARRTTLQTVFWRFIALQCQSYRCQFVLSNTFPPPEISLLLSFCLKYWFRVSKIEFAHRHTGHWLRPVQASLLLLITTPIATLKLLFAHVSRSGL